MSACVGNLAATNGDTQICRALRISKSRLGVMMLALGALLAANAALADDKADKKAKDEAEAAEYLGFFGRFFKAYADEWGKTAPPSDPKTPAPVTRRPEPFPPAPVTQPPYPFHGLALWRRKHHWRQHPECGR